MQEMYMRSLVELYNRSETHRFEGSHCHRIIPGYLGGTYNDENIIYVTQRQHCLIHWLRWKIWKDSRDKRAYKMIGCGPSGLSHQDRVDHGKLCVENKIGIHGANSEEKRYWSKMSIDKQKENFEKNGTKNFYYWSTTAGRKERASMGGKKSILTNQAMIDRMGHWKNDIDYARECGMKAPKKPVHLNGIIKKFYTEEERNEFLKNNPEWIKGHGMTHRRGVKCGPSHRRKSVTDGSTIFDSIKDAADHYIVTSSTIINWCKSDKKPNWRYYE